MNLHQLHGNKKETNKRLSEHKRKTRRNMKEKPRKIITINDNSWKNKTHLIGAQQLQLQLQHQSLHILKVFNYIHI